MKATIANYARALALAGLFLLVLAGCGSQTTNSSGQTIVNLGYFPNMTHAVALVGVERGTFQQELGSKVQLKTTTFNAGPAEMTALLAGDIDIAFVGPNSAISSYVHSHGQALRIIAGASSGGVLFVVRPGANINSAKDLAGKKIADPQLGGTQDISLRYYLKQNGLTPADKGGNVQIVPTDNATILTLFKEGKIDGAWVPEPWGTRLIVEGKGKLFLDERSLWHNGQFDTTDIVVSTKFMNAHADLVSKFLQADVDTVSWIQNNPDSAKSIINSEIKRLTGKGFNAQELTMAYNNLQITYDPLSSSVLQAADREYTLGFLGTSKPDLTSLFNLGPLNVVLSSKGLATVQ